MAPNLKQVIMGVVALLVIASIAGIAFVGIGTLEDQVIEWAGTNYTVSEVVPSSVLALIPLILIMFVIGLAIAFIPNMS